MSDSEFLVAFEACSLPAERFHHRDHVRLAWLMLRADPLPAALRRFCEGLQRYAARLGKTGLYHETITVAYLLLIQERMARSGAADAFSDFAENNPDLLSWRPSVLERYYRKATLESELARRVFLLPDRLDGIA